MDLLLRALKFAINASVALAFVAGMLLTFYVDRYKVPHNGMAPSMVYDDEVLVWRNASADLGNIMLCEHPGRPGELVFGRAIVFAGHTISNDHLQNLYVDHDRTTTEQLGPQRFYDVTQNKLFIMRLALMEYGGQHTHPFYIEEGKTFAVRTYQVNRGIYLLGDNRTDPDHDSRAFGEVDPAACRGQVFMRLRPAPSNNDEIDHSYLDIID